MVAPLLMVLHPGLIMLAQQAPALPSVIPWFPVAMVAALAVMLIAALLYVLAPILNSSAMQQWSRFQVYEAVLSIALILIFLGVVSLIFTNPQPSLTQAGLVPRGCTDANTIFALSACDLSQFNTASYTLTGYLWAFQAFKFLIPTSKLAIRPLPQEGENVEFEVTIPSLLGAVNTDVLKYLIGALLVALLLSQIQLILVSSALLFMSLFFAIGLITRIFGISRSFGGAMIAFGIGLGIIYPMLICVTYGYLDVTASTYCLQSFTATVGCAGTSFGTAFFNTYLTSVPSFLTLFNPTTAAAYGAAVQLAQLPTYISIVFNEIGYILAGLSAIPIINILIVDVFIVDFSKAVGEQMSFSMLFRGVI